MHIAVLCEEETAELKLRANYYSSIAYYTMTKNCLTKSVTNDRIKKKRRV